MKNNIVMKETVATKIILYGLWEIITGFPFSGVLLFPFSLFQSTPLDYDKEEHFLK